MVVLPNTALFECASTATLVLLSRPSSEPEGMRDLRDFIALSSDSVHQDCF